MNYSYSDPDDLLQLMTNYTNLVMMNNNAINSFEYVSGVDKRRLRDYRDTADARFRQTDASLELAFDTKITYTRQIGMINGANGIVQHSVKTLESYMDPAVVDKENKAHSIMSMWKWLTIGSGGIGLLFGFNAAKNHRRVSYRRRYRY